MQSPKPVLTALPGATWINAEHVLCQVLFRGHRDTRRGYDTDLGLEQLPVLLGKKTQPPKVLECKVENKACD